MTTTLNQKQIQTMAKIELLSRLFGVDPKWTVAVAMVESSMGTRQRSPTGARGVFQMTTIAMKDLLLSMETDDDDLADIACGILFLRLLYRRWGSVEKATEHYCSPADIEFYLPKVMALIEANDKEYYY